MTPNWLPSTAHRLGLAESAISFTRTRVGQTLHVPCAKGDHLVDVEVRANLHPNGVAKQMLNAGWTVGRRLVCPDCNNKSKKAATMSETIDRSPPSDAAKKAHRLMMMALEDYYDEANKRYKPGYSDAKIAEETGASEAHVKKTREEYFGPLGQPVELEAVKSELSALQAMMEKTMAQFREQISAAQSRIARICNINGWPVE